MNTTTQHPQSAEVWRFLETLTAAGFALASVDDDGDLIEVYNIAGAAEVITGVDLSWLYVTHPQFYEGTRRLCIMIVLGNGPGELAADYFDEPMLADCINQWSESEEARASK